MLASAVVAAVAAKCQVPVFLGAMAVLANNGLVALACGARRLRRGSVPGYFARGNVFTRPRVGGRSSVGASVLACNWCSRALPSIPGRWAVARERARLQATASSAPVVVAPCIGASALAAQAIACSAAALAPTKGCCLTLRSWGLPPARHLARAPASVIIRRAGQAPSRRQPLSSNVRPHSSPRCQRYVFLNTSHPPIGGRSSSSVFVGSAPTCRSSQT